MKKYLFTGLICITLMFAGAVSAFAGSNSASNVATEEEEFNATEFILEHIQDSHEWHILTKENGEHLTVYLPVILVSKERGLDMFSYKHLAHGEEYNGYVVLEEGNKAGKIAFADNKDKLPLDFSITKTVVGMLFSVLIGFALFIPLSRSYKKTGISEPKGIQRFLEPIIVFVRDEIARPNLGEEKYGKYMPYLLTVFFFIFINNLLGLMPGWPPLGANVTGNIAVTLVLALCTFFITQFSGNREYWKDIFWTPGLPLWLRPIMIPVEVIGMFTKPFALTIRLFANITAGHIIVLSLVCIIFIMGTLVIAPVSFLFVIFMDCIELLVAFLQSFIFTLLSALFIGLAMPEGHGHN